jgi:hypothetical protein
MNKNILLEEIMLFFKSDSFKEELQTIIKPLLNYLFKEIYIYFMFFIFFILSSFFLHLSILFLLIKYNKQLKYNN